MERNEGKIYVVRERKCHGLNLNLLRKLVIYHKPLLLRKTLCVGPHHASPPLFEILNRGASEVSCEIASKMATVYGTEIEVPEEAKEPIPTEMQAQENDQMEVDEESHEKPEPENQQGRKGKSGKTPTADQPKLVKNKSDQQHLDHRNQEEQNQDRTHQVDDTHFFFMGGALKHD
jgi:hypothetical protein